MESKNKMRKGNGKPQQRGTIQYQKWSISKYPGHEKDVTVLMDKEGNMTYIRLNNGMIVKK